MGCFPRSVTYGKMARKRCSVAIFSFKRGKIDRWYKQELKALNENYYNFKVTNSNSNPSETGIQASNNRNNQLTAATEALKKEYLKKLKEIGEKPRGEFLNSIDNS